MKNSKKLSKLVVLAVLFGGVMGMGVLIPKAEAFTTTIGGAIIDYSSGTPASPYGVAIGESIIASGNNSIAVGCEVVASGNYSAAFGLGSTETYTEGEHSGEYKYGAIGNGSFVTGGVRTYDNLLLIVNPNTVTGTNAVAMGEGNIVSDTNSFAFGGGNWVEEHYSVAMGEQNRVFGCYDTAMGMANFVTGNWGVAMGHTNFAGGFCTVAIGGLNSTEDYCTVAMGLQNVSRGNGSVAMGWRLTSGKTNTSTSSSTPFDGAYYTAAFGLGNSAIGSGAFVAGGAGEPKWDYDELFDETFWNNTSNPNIASGRNAVAMGEGSTAKGNNSVAMGNGAYAGPDNTFAFGGTVADEHTGSVALGYGSVTGGEYEVSVGSSTQTRKITNVTAGTADTDAVNFAQLKEYGATKVGGTTVANSGSGINFVAGENVTITSSGNDITISATGGGESFFEKVGTSDNISMLTKGKITNVSEGELSSTSTDVVTGKQLFTTNAQVETNKTNIAANATAIGKIQNYVTDDGLNANNKKITNVAAGTSAYDAVNYGQYTELANTMERGFSKVNEDIGRTGAASAALASLHPQMMRKGESQVMAGMGRYHGKSGAAVGLAWQPHKRIMLSGGFADAAGEIMFNFGASYKFGQHSYTAEQLAEINNGTGLPLYVAELNAVLKSKDVQIMNLKSDNAAIKADNAAMKNRLEKLEIIVADLLKAKK